VRVLGSQIRQTGVRETRRVCTCCAALWATADAGDRPAEAPETQPPLAAPPRSPRAPAGAAERCALAASQAEACGTAPPALPVSQAPACEFASPAAPPRSLWAEGTVIPDTLLPPSAPPEPSAVACGGAGEAVPDTLLPPSAPPEPSASACGGAGEAVPDTLLPPSAPPEPSASAGGGAGEAVPDTLLPPSALPEPSASACGGVGEAVPDTLLPPSALPEPGASAGGGAGGPGSAASPAHVEVRAAAGDARGGMAVEAGRNLQAVAPGALSLSRCCSLGAAAELGDFDVPVEAASGARLPRGAAQAGPARAAMSLARLVRGACAHAWKASPGTASLGQECGRRTARVPDGRLTAGPPGESAPAADGSGFDYFLTAAPSQAPAPAAPWSGATPQTLSLHASPAVRDSPCAARACLAALHACGGPPARRHVTQRAHVHGARCSRALRRVLPARRCVLCRRAVGAGAACASAAAADRAAAGRRAAARARRGQRAGPGLGRHARSGQRAVRRAAPGAGGPARRPAAGRVCFRQRTRGAGLCSRAAACGGPAG